MSFIPDRIKNTKIYKRILQSKAIRTGINRYIERRKMVSESRDNDSPWSFLKYSDESYYLERICYWKGIIDCNKYQKEEIQNKIGNRKYNDHRIAIIVELLSGRCCKICKELRKCGFTLEIYIKSGIDDNLSNKTVLKCFTDNWKEWSNVGELMALLVDSEAFVAHFFMAWDDAGNACAILNQRDLFMPICVESYDVLNGMYYNQLPSSLKRERFAYENASGVVFREFSGKFLEAELGVKIKNQLIFWDYIDNETVVEDDRISDHDSDSELQLVYVGGISTKNSNPGSPFACLDILANKCMENHCHLHIYPAGLSEIQKKDLEEIGQANQYFHVHKSLPYYDLIREISKYDFGIHHSTRDIFSEHVGGTHTREKMIYSGANKFFDYLSAGLPIVSAVCVKFGKLFEERGMLLPWTIEDYNFDFLKQKRDEMKRNVRSGREFFYLNLRIEELIAFYKTISEERNV